MQNLNLHPLENLSSLEVIRDHIFPKLPGFTLRDNGTAFIVFESCLIEVLPQEIGKGIATSVHTQGPRGLLDKEISYLLFAHDDVRGVITAIGELMQKARARSWSNV